MSTRPSKPQQLAPCREPDTIYCEAFLAPEDIYSAAPEDGIYSSPKSRRLCYEAAGQRFLEGQLPFLLSTTLKGPFDKASGWVNPWRTKSRPQRDSDIKHSASSIKLGEVPEDGLRSIEEAEVAIPDSMDCHLPSPQSLKQAFTSEEHPYLAHDEVSVVHTWRNGIQNQQPEDDILPWPSAVQRFMHKRKSNNSGWLKSNSSKRRKTGLRHSQSSPVRGSLRGQSDDHEPKSTEPLFSNKSIQRPSLSQSFSQNFSIHTSGPKVSKAEGSLETRSSSANAWVEACSRTRQRSPQCLSQERPTGTVQESEDAISRAKAAATLSSPVSLKNGMQSSPSPQQARREAGNYPSSPCIFDKHIRLKEDGQGLDIQDSGPASEGDASLLETQKDESFLFKLRRKQTSPERFIGVGGFTRTSSKSPMKESRTSFASATSNCVVAGQAQTQAFSDARLGKSVTPDRDQLPKKSSSMTNTIMTPRIKETSNSRAVDSISENGMLAEPDTQDFHPATSWGEHDLAMHDSTDYTTMNTMNMDVEVDAGSVEESCTLVAASVEFETTMDSPLGAETNVPQVHSLDEAAHELAPGTESRTAAPRKTDQVSTSTQKGNAQDAYDLVDDTVPLSLRKKADYATASESPTSSALRLCRKRARKVSLSSDEQMITNTITPKVGMTEVATPRTSCNDERQAGIGCSSRRNDPSQSVERGSSSRTRDQSPWAKTVDTTCIIHRMEDGIDQSSNASQEAEHLTILPLELQSPWAPTRIIPVAVYSSEITNFDHGKTADVATPTSPLLEAKNTDGMDQLSQRRPIIRPSTPEPRFNVKPFAAFMTPSPERRARQTRLSLRPVSEDDLASAMKNPWNNSKPTKRVTWALPCQEPGTSQSPCTQTSNAIVAVAHPGGRPSSPPPLTPVDELPLAEHDKFAKHFSAVARKKDGIKRYLNPAALYDGKRLHVGSNLLYENTAADSKGYLFGTVTGHDEDGEQQDTSESENPAEVMDELFRDIGEMLDVWNVEAELDEIKKVQSTLL
ncbi:hypothetical protein S7711_06827 [Stachybotrys chartarum IBT 7711]|uniref:Protamine P1 n=1 Tax=Stachybotrys chartarum (strain CBS 109288 / IBT 7711) TaxID=1280523 RepID=A0A084AYH4_STACB|nr:hypothetical protein S7711_06827 [Stachybotrys chartarum IBT 7711]